MAQHFVQSTKTGDVFAVRVEGGVTVAAAGPVRFDEVVVELLDELLRDHFPPLANRINLEPARFRAIRAPHL